MNKTRLLLILLATAIVFSLLTGMSSTETTGFSTNTDGAGWELYVSTDGDDSNPGTIDKPLKTIEGARDVIRKSSSRPAGGIVVYIREGFYPLTHGIVLDGRDSGRADCPITYCAYKDEKVVISGGVELDTSKFTKVSGEMKNRLRDKNAQNKVLVLDLTAQGITELGTLFEGDIQGAEVYVNGNRLNIARYPNGIQYTCLLFPVGTEAGGAISQYSDLDAVIDKWSYKAGDDGFVFGYLTIDYTHNMCKLLNVDTANRTFEMGPGGGNYNNYAKCCFINIYDEIDEPGEYYIDRKTGKLYVYPTDELLAGGQLTISQCPDTLLSINDCRYVNVKGLNFEASRRNGISMSGSDLTLDGNRITGIAGTAVSAHGDRFKIINNRIDNVAGCGIVYRGGDKVSLTPAETYIDNNCVTNYAIYGDTYMSGIEVGGNGIIVSHNEIAYAPHQAIEYDGNNIIFEYNRIHNVCQRTSDAGAIYSGRTWLRDSCIIRYNFIYDIHNKISYDSEGNEQGHPHGIYWDDALSGQIAYGNIIFDISGNGFHIGGGHHNQVYNNIIIKTGDLYEDHGNGYAIAYDTRASAGNWASQLIPYSLSNSMWNAVNGLLSRPYTDTLWQFKFPILALIKETNYPSTTDPDVGGNNSYAVIRNNIIVEKKTIGLFEGPLAVYSTMRDNVLYKSRYDVGFVDCDNLDFTLRPDAAPLFELAHFEVVDCTSMGLRK